MKLTDFDFEGLFFFILDFGDLDECQPFIMPSDRKMKNAKSKAKQSKDLTFFQPKKKPKQNTLSESGNSYHLSKLGKC